MGWCSQPLSIAQSLDDRTIESTLRWSLETAELSRASEISLAQEEESERDDRIRGGKVRRFACRNDCINSRGSVGQLLAVLTTRAPWSFASARFY